MKDVEYFFDSVESCEMIGEFNNEYVYDIEVDDETHTFIGNDILVHNSLYLSYEPIMKSIGYEGNELDFILHIDKVFVKGLFKDYLNTYSSSYSVENFHDFELETVNKSAIHLKKKHYINNVLWEDGIFYDDLSYFYPKGIEVVRSTTPSFVRGKDQRGGIWDFIRYLFSNPTNLEIRNILKLVKEQRQAFEMDDIDNISMNISCSNYNNKVIDDINSIETEKGAHFSVKASAFHNYMLNKNSDYKTKYDMVKSGKIKYYYTTHPMNNVFAYLRSFHPYEITEKESINIDYNTQFEKSYLSLVNKFIEPLGLPLINKRLSVLNSLFSFKK